MAKPGMFAGEREKGKGRERESEEGEEEEEEEYYTFSMDKRREERESMNLYSCTGMCAGWEEWRLGKGSGRDRGRMLHRFCVGKEGRKGRE